MPTALFSAAPEHRSRHHVGRKPHKKLSADLSAPKTTGIDLLLAVQYSRLDPDWFCRNILRSPNDPWQIDCLHALADIWKHQESLPTVINHQGQDKITIRAMHAPGKTHWAAKAMHWFNFCWQGRIVATAPKQQQLLTRLWPEFTRLNLGAIAEYRRLINCKTSKIIWNNDPTWYAIAETASQPENLAGHHHDYLLFVVDEASGVPEEMFPVIEAAQAGGKLVVILLIGNPTRTEGTFWSSHCLSRVSKNYFTYHIQLDKAPRVSPKWVAEQISKYGEDSPVVKVRCFGEFAVLTPDQLIALEWLEAARGREIKADPKTSRLRISVDVADGGVDETIIIASRLYEDHTEFLRLRRFSFPTAESPIRAAQAAEEMWNDFGGRKENGDDFVVDSMGVGSGTAGHLIVERQLPVLVYKGGESSDDPEQWRNRRVQSYLVLRNALRDGWLTIADDFCADELDWQDFLSQVCGIRRKPGTERVEDLETKTELLRRVTKSPDMADAAAMVFASARPVMGSRAAPMSLASAPVITSQNLVAAKLDLGNEGIEGMGAAAELDW